MSVSSLDELTEARRRAGLQDNGDHPAEDEAADARSIADRAADGDGAGEPEELFVLEQGKKVTLSQLIGRNTPVEYVVQLSGLTQKGGDALGLVGYSDPDFNLVVPVRAGKVITDPTYDSDGRCKKVVIKQQFKPRGFMDARGDRAREALGQD